MVLKTTPCRARTTFTHFAARDDMTDIIWFLLHRLFGCGLTKKAYTAKLPLTLTSRIAVALYGSGMPNYQVGPHTCILLTLCRSYLHRWLLSCYCAMSNLRIVDDRFQFVRARVCVIFVSDNCSKTRRPTLSVPFCFRHFVELCSRPNLHNSHVA